MNSRKTNRGILLIGLLALYPPLEAQDQPPGTDIFLVELSRLAAPPLNVTSRPGYDNQPFFSADGRRLYYTRIDGEQADIYAYDLESGTAEPLLQSPESEYSPTLMPGGQALSVIRVESDQRQRLWAIPLDGSAPQLLFPELEPVGYHAWAGPGVAAAFILGEPFTLQLIRAGGRGRVMREDIGRAIVSHPRQPSEIAFVHKSDAGPWMIELLDSASGAIKPLTATLAQREDFTIGPDGAYWMGSESELYCWLPGSDGWRLMADFGAQGVINITRLAIDPAGARLALVSDEIPSG